MRSAAYRVEPSGIKTLDLIFTFLNVDASDTFHTEDAPVTDTFSAKMEPEAERTPSDSPAKLIAASSRDNLPSTEIFDVSTPTFLSVTRREEERPSVISKESVFTVTPRDSPSTVTFDALNVPGITTVEPFRFEAKRIGAVIRYVSAYVIASTSDILASISFTLPSRVLTTIFPALSIYAGRRSLLTISPSESRYSKARTPGRSSN